MQQKLKRLSELLPPGTELSGDDVVVSGISQDSRAVNAGDLFVARSGLSHRGIDFVEAAVVAGAVAVLIDTTECEDCPQVSVPVIGISYLAAHIGVIASVFYDYPSQNICMVGVTGTNGKTSCAHFIAQALNTVGVPAAVIGTIGNGFPGKLKPATHTTPDAIALQRLLAELVAEGAKAVVMEVSSHALEQGRVAGVAFDYGLFSNLSRDHLDYHGTMEAYGEAKARLFRDFDLQAGIFNIDDGFAKSLYQDAGIGGKRIAVGRAQGDCHIIASRLTLKGVELEVKTPLGHLTITSQVIGDFNIDNLLLVIAVLVEQGLSLPDLEKAMTSLQAVPGRMQALVKEGKPLVIVDYAHTPDALEKALQAARSHTQGQLWCVFGCGGDRDHGKRPLMGQAVARYADRLVVTSDNPRTEKPEAIIAMVCEGVNQVGVKAADTVVEPDRRAALAVAIEQAEAQDVILVAGKGHEDYQEINNVRCPFSDVAVCHELLEVTV